MTSKQKTVIRSPWGVFQGNPADPDYHEKLLKHCIAQLKYYLRHRRSPDPAKTRDDLEGYEEVLAAGRPAIRRFFELKESARDRGFALKNKDVIALMKSQGEWRE